MIHDFQTDLEYSLKASENTMFHRFYFRVFPHLLRVETVRDELLQKQGVDKILHFEGHKTILIDEKKRRKDYGDILLEEYSDYDRRKPGWLSKDKHTDYIVYAIMPSQKVYLLPFLILQLVWIKHYKDWKEKYNRVYSLNRTYRTSNLPIPTDVLLQAMKEEMQQRIVEIGT